MNGFYRFTRRAISLVVVVSLIGCSSTRRQYATDQQSVSLPSCSLKPLSISAISAPAHWSGACGIDGAEGSGLAVWGKTDRPVARFTGNADHGLIDGQKASFLDAKISFNGLAKDGGPYLGVLKHHGKSQQKGDVFEGRFSLDGSYDQGVLRKADGSVVAGRFSGTQPTGEVVVRTVDGVLHWAWAGQNGSIKLGRVVRVSQDGAALGALGIVLLAAGLGMFFLATGALTVGMVMAAALTPARVVLIAII